MNQNKHKIKTFKQYINENINSHTDKSQTDGCINKYKNPQYNSQQVAVV